MVPFTELGTQEEVLSWLLWERVGEERSFGFEHVEFYLEVELWDKAVVSWGPVSTFQRPPWSFHLENPRHSTWKPACIAAPNQISTAGFEGYFARPCPRHSYIMTRNHSWVVLGPFHTQEDEAQRAHATGLQRRERGARDLRILVL